MHHSRKRFLSLGWSTIERRFGKLNLLLIVFTWAPINLHLFRPLFTGEAPSEIDWLTRVAPDSLDETLLKVSVSGYCFALMLASFYQYACMLVCMATHTLSTELLTLRTERLYQHAKRALQMPAAAQDIWLKHIARWRHRLNGDAHVLLKDPLSRWWVITHSILVSVYSLLFLGVLFYTRGAQPNNVIFLASMTHLSMLVLYLAVTDKGIALADRLASRWMQPNQTFTNKAFPKGKTVETGADADTVVSPSQAAPDRQVSFAPEPLKGTGTTPETAKDAPATPIQREANQSTMEFRPSETKRGSHMLHRYNVLDPRALIPRLLPTMLWQALIISMIWIGWVLLRCWINNLECYRDPVDNGYLSYDFTRCTSASFRQMSVEWALVPTVRPEKSSCFELIIDSCSLAFLCAFATCVCPPVLRSIDPGLDGMAAAWLSAVSPYDPGCRGHHVFERVHLHLPAVVRVGSRRTKDGLV